MNTRHIWIFRRDARLSHPIAALRLLAIEPAITRRRALLSGTIDAPRLPQNPYATGMTVGDLRSNVCSLGTRHAPVTRKFFRQPPRFPGSPPSSLPRFAASDDGAFERGAPPARLSPGMRPANPMVAAVLRRSVTCPPGSTGAAGGGPALGCASWVGLAPPWRARPGDSVDS